MCLLSQHPATYLHACHDLARSAGFIFAVLRTWPANSWDGETCPVRLWQLAALATVPLTWDASTGPVTVSQVAAAAMIGPRSWLAATAPVNDWQVTVLATVPVI
jgi:hypothetical protein